MGMIAGNFHLVILSNQLTLLLVGIDRFIFSAAVNTQNCRNN